MNYYNEHDRFAAAWLIELIEAGHIAPGIVDTRNIEDVRPDELKEFTQCHFFAGIGGWSAALRLAGWPDDKPVWTGSCPCQPFSAAGKGSGTADERHLWPAWFHLIKQCRPGVIFGEQVEAAIQHGWLDLVQDDLEGIGYAVAAVGLPAACVGAPHIRQRLWFVAESLRAASERRTGGVLRAKTPVSSAWLENGNQFDGLADGGETSQLADPDSPRRGARRPSKASDGRDATREQLTGLHIAGQLGQPNSPGPQPRRATSASMGHGDTPDTAGGVGNMGDTEHPGFQEQLRQPGISCGTPATDAGQTAERTDAGQTAERTGAGQAAERTGASTFWDACDWLPCRDGKARPVEPGTFPLAHGVSARVGRLRGYGNAIVPQVAAEVIKAYLV